MLLAQAATAAAQAAASVAATPVPICPAGADDAHKNIFQHALDPLTSGLSTIVVGLHHLIPNYGWALIALAAVVRLVLWPLADMQFKSMAAMQKIAPLLKDLQKRYKGDPQTLQLKTMELYREHKANPAAGCLPLVIQMPILIGMYWAINAQCAIFADEKWLWIGSPLSAHMPVIHNVPLLGTSLASGDIFLLALYALSMYFTIRYGSPPSSDPQQASTQRIMSFISPAMIAYFGFQYQLHSAFYIYWLASNVFTVGQQLYMYRKYGLWGANAKPAPATSAASAPATPVGPSTNGTAKPNGKPPATKYQSRAKKRSRR